MKHNETTPVKEKDKIPIRRTLLIRCHPPFHPTNRTRNGGFVAYPGNHEGAKAQRLHEEKN